MVYRGRPSKGCELCRARKIKCSQDRPACEQCVKHGVACPGYRDLQHANFLDESKAIIRRARSTKHAGQTNVLSSSSSSSLALDLPPLPASISHPLEDKAIGYFYGQFLMVGFSSLLPNRSIVRDADTVLSNAVMCTATAALANFTKSPQMLSIARRKYAQALVATNAALASPQRAREDPTLAAVLLLGMFENLDCDSAERMTNWQNHIRGLSSLLKLHDPAKMMTQAGFELFAQIRPIILLNALWDHTLVPDQWVEHLHYSDNHHTSKRTKHVNALMWACIDIANLRAKIRNRTLADPFEIYRQAVWLDSQLAKWEAACFDDPEWKYTEIYEPDADPKVIWRGVYHVYHDFAASGQWSMMRCFRLILLNMISFRLQQLGVDSNIEEQLQLARSRSKIMSDMLAEAPRKLGYKHGSFANDTPAMELPLMPAYYEQLSLFALSQYMILTIEEARDECDFVYLASLLDPNATADWEETIGAGRRERYEQLQWILNRLEYIAELGIRQGAVYATMLRTRLDNHFAKTATLDNTGPWKHARTAKERSVMSMLDDISFAVPEPA